MRVTTCDPLRDIERCLTARLDHWADMAPDRVFLATCLNGTLSRQLTYAEARQMVRACAQSLLDLNARGAVVLIAAQNSIEHAVLTLGALYCGQAVATISPALVKRGGNLETLYHIVDRVQPGHVLVDIEDNVAPEALALLGPDVRVVATTPSPFGARAVEFETLLDAVATGAVDTANRCVTPDSLAKILFTSGSTGMPKAVPNTHGMIGAVQQGLVQCWPFLEGTFPTLLDWLPWNHTFGGNHNLHLILHNGGTLYIDDGRPTPALFSRTLANMRIAQPTVLFNVPLAYSMLADALEGDPELAAAFLPRLKFFFSGSSSLAIGVQQRLDAISMRACGYEIPWLGGYGMTETGALATTGFGDPCDGRGMGLPIPGEELKLAPVDDLLELRIRGPNIMHGYLYDDRATSEAFDDEGYFRTGDAVEWIDADLPERGLAFRCRIGENFKLSSGTWVNVGGLKASFVAACQPFVRDVVVAGHDRDEIALLVFLTASAAERHPVVDKQTGHPLPIAPQLRQRIEDALSSIGKDAGSAGRPQRAIILPDCPSAEHGEVTDKGSINQRRVLANRSSLVARLYAPSAANDPEIIHRRTPGTGPSEGQSQ
ncbi:MAG: AMP-binding protein [Mesorhizobium sp.]|nr:AMP-binding protein [Mesorhizobium sp.]